MTHHRMGGAAGMVAVLLLAAACSANDESSRAGAMSSAPTSADSEGTEMGANARCEPLPDLPRGRIAYTQTREDGSTALYLMKPDGSDRRCLVDTDGSDSWPAWSPDGRLLAFIGGPDGREQIFLVRADGTGLQQVTDSGDYKSSVVWSPDGRWIGYSASGSREGGPFSIHRFDIDGTPDRTVASSHAPEVPPVGLLDWSPDGTTLLYGADGGAGIGLWTMSPAGRDKAFLRGEPGDFGSGAIYSPDGTSLVFQADLDGGCIYRSDARARHLVRLTHGCSNGFTLDWSPDGRWIVWAGGAHGPADAEVMAADGTQRHTIVDDASVAYTAWQPRPQG